MSTIHFHHSKDLPPLDRSKVPTLIEKMTAIVGKAGVLTHKAELTVYECDGFMVDRNAPDVVVFPTTTAQVAEIVKTCNELDVPYVARGAGTSVWRVALLRWGAA